MREDVDMARTDPVSGGGATPRTPRWVKMFGVVAIILVVAFLILHLTGNGPQGHGHGHG
jgi:hypothetical protein